MRSKRPETMLTLLLVGIFVLGFSVQRAKTGHTTRLLLETDKDVYRLRENVTITLTNVGNETVEIGGYPAWQVFTYPEEEPVYPKIFAFLLWSLDPGQNDTFVWNQYDQFTENFVEPGTYVVKDTKGWGLSARFTITAIIVPDDYSTIQEAVNNANEGDTIYARAGTYQENVVLNKTVSLIGEDKRNTAIIFGKTIVTITAPNVHISCFEVALGETGIYIFSTDNARINDCVIANNALIGIAIEQSDRINVVNNLIDWNRLAGISLRSSHNNTIIQNTISNTTAYRSSIAIGAYYSNDSVIYHNNFINSLWDPSKYYASFNKWDDGYPSGGNYWSSYIGVDLFNGPYQNISGSDGIGDPPHIINANNRDNYPLMNPYLRPLPNWNPADINHDLKVDIKDLAKAALAYGSYPGHPKWDPQADITGPTLLQPDDKVDIRDIAYIAMNYGKVKPP